MYLEDPRNPRWVAKPTVAYLWARTAECGDCRAEIPLLKTRWLCRRGDKRVLLVMTPRRRPKAKWRFGLESGRSERVGYDDELGAGTMSQSGAECPCCGAIATMQDLRAQGRAGRLGMRMTAVVVDGQEGKEYRLPTQGGDSRRPAVERRTSLKRFYRGAFRSDFLEEPTPKSERWSISGMLGGCHATASDTWDKLFTQPAAPGAGGHCWEAYPAAFRRRWLSCGYPTEWREALVGCLAPSISRLADRC